MLSLKILVLSAEMVSQFFQSKAPFIRIKQYGDPANLYKDYLKCHFPLKEKYITNYP